ncbi:uncharacterized protein LOC131668525 [Phymastichus coffea]|uniref:uncharacterized protein LOC131668525 n=1 Tax=Phymastichus coffea TaxID=108790 RepID=UPI00273BFACD|nr:uncharacterized protein LOC131668525 [Phymastichus coffea]
MQGQTLERQAAELPSSADRKVPRLQLLKSEADGGGDGGKTKRKARSTRRRLNAMMSNASLHFSDTDSEGELQAPRAVTPTRPPSARLGLCSDSLLLRPTISVTLDASGDDSSRASGDRRGSFLDCLTDVDELCASEPEPEPGSEGGAEPPAPPQVETELEDLSSDEADEPSIYVEPRGDILVDFGGETITTKEGDGPFSVEVRNQMSLDDGPSGGPAREPAPEIAFAPATDSEDMEASDDDDEDVVGQLGSVACGLREGVVEELEVLAASQILMKNCSKTDQLLAVKEPDDVLSDAGHTDIEDLE